MHRDRDVSACRSWSTTTSAAAANAYLCDQWAQKSFCVCLRVFCVAPAWRRHRLHNIYCICIQFSLNGFLFGNRSKPLWPGWKNGHAVILRIALRPQQDTNTQIFWNVCVCMQYVDCICVKYAWCGYTFRGGHACVVRCASDGCSKHLFRVFGMWHKYDFVSMNAENVSFDICVFGASRGSETVILHYCSYVLDYSQNTQNIIAGL